MDFSSLEKLFKARRSVRQWKSAPVSEELLTKAIEAAGWCPNSGGRQPYHCYVITNPAKIAEIGQAVQEVSDYLASLCTEESDRQAVERWQKNSAFFAKAPALIAVSASIYQSIADKLQASNMDKPRVAEINRCRQLASSRVQTAAAFVDHLLLALHTLGLGAVWMVGPTQAKSAVEKIIGMGKQEDFVALVPVGYPDEQPAAPAHKPLSELVTFLR
ncbi:MAG: nitroreductase family protein [Negativicutes bacterium]|nr:nitroreductase family protein [Negativicutes bacterium]MDR3589948.1 nitroreductase family protein [Negativicutes bacterium]